MLKSAYQIFNEIDTNKELPLLTLAIQSGPHTKKQSFCLSVVKQGYSITNKNYV